MTRDEFKQLDCKLVSQRKVGDGSPMGTDGIDTYQASDGRTIVHHWGMGGESFTVTTSADPAGGNL